MALNRMFSMERHQQLLNLQLLFCGRRFLIQIRSVTMDHSRKTKQNNTMALFCIFQANQVWNIKANGFGEGNWIPNEDATNDSLLSWCALLRARSDNPLAQGDSPPLVSSIQANGSPSHNEPAQKGGQWELCLPHGCKHGSLRPLKFSMTDAALETVPGCAGQDYSSTLGLRKHLLLINSLVISGVIKEPLNYRKYGTSYRSSHVSLLWHNPRRAERLDLPYWMQKKKKK